MTEYHFTTLWQIEAPLEQVCAAIEHSLCWPQWWQGAERVEEIDPGDADGLGNIRRYTWRGRLPYRLTFDIRVTRIRPLASVEGIASGEVTGRGCWTFHRDGDTTWVRYDWQVCITRRWMRWLARLAWPIFKWNHDIVMQRGGEGLARRLNARLRVVAHRGRPSTARPTSRLNRTRHAPEG